jgi:hypothetical protein
MNQNGSTYACAKLFSRILANSAQIKICTEGLVSNLVTKTQLLGSLLLAHGVLLKLAVLIWS